MSEDGIKFDSNAAELLGRIESFKPAVRGALMAGLRRGLLLAKDRVKSGTGIRERRGSAGLMGRLTWYAERSGNGVDAAIGFRKTKGFPYELSQEFGAHAKPGKAMAIPVTAAARKAGSPRNFPGALFIPKGKHVLMKQGARSLVQYVLVKSIPARLRFRENVVAAFPAIANEVKEEYQKAVSAI